MIYPWEFSEMNRLNWSHTSHYTLLMSLSFPVFTPTGFTCSFHHFLHNTSNGLSKLSCPKTEAMCKKRIKINFLIYLNSRCVCKDFNDTVKEC